MAQKKVNKQNQQLIGQQTIDRQYFEQLEASTDNKQPEEWMDFYEAQANETKKRIIANHYEREESMDSFDAAKRDIKKGVSFLMKEKAKEQPDAVTLAGFNHAIQDARTRMKMHGKNSQNVMKRRKQLFDQMDETWKRRNHWNLVKNGWSWNDQSKFGRFYYVTQEVLQCVLSASDDETAESISKKVMKIRKELNVELVQGLTNPIFV